MFLHFPLLFRVLRLTFTPRYFHPVHAVAVVVLLTLFLGLWLVVKLGRGVDHLLFRRYRTIAIESPIYIMGNPRSGTTFLHRLMALDSQFSATTLADTIFPAVGFYKLFRFLNRHRFPLKKALYSLIFRLESQGFSNWDTIHKTQLNDMEEEEQLFVFTLLSPVIMLLFPFPAALPEACYVDGLSHRRRRRLMAYYYDCLQRHAYTHGPHKTLLLKNTTMAGRLQSTLERFPQLRMVHVVRHPYESIPSFLSMNQASWQAFVPQASHSNAPSQAIARLYCDYFRRYQAFGQQLPPENVFEVSYEQLKTKPQATVEAIYRHFGLDLTPDYAQQLHQVAQKAKTYRSAHRYSLQDFGLSEQLIYEQMPDMFELHHFQP